MKTPQLSHLTFDYYVYIYQEYIEIIPNLHKLNNSKISYKCSIKMNLVMLFNNNKSAYERIVTTESLTNQLFLKPIIMTLISPDNVNQFKCLSFYKTNIC